METPVTIQGDKEKLTDAFEMLVRNAVDAVPDGGRLWITSRVVGCGVEITCEDSGGGIPPEDLARIFSPMFTSKTGMGSGLQWTLARLVFHAHGAELKIQTTHGQGTRVTISLPGTSATSSSTDRMEVL